MQPTADLPSVAALPKPNTCDDIQSDPGYLCFSLGQDWDAAPPLASGENGVDSRQSAIIVNYRTFVLTAELRGTDDPNQKNVIGALELQLTQSIGDPTIFQAVSTAHLLALDKSYTGGVIIDNDTGSVSDPNQRGGQVFFRWTPASPMWRRIT